MASDSTSTNRLPPWLKKRVLSGHAIHSMKTNIRSSGLKTVCEEARCPNLGECFSSGTATFMIMGSVCTRHCGFCAVASGKPAPLDPTEPARVAEEIKRLGISHAVVTSVTRDDIPDGGASHFAETIRKIRAADKSITIEVLTPDFLGSEGSIKAVCEAVPDIFNHNIETVERLTSKVRNGAFYSRSLKVLSLAKKHLPNNGLTKSGLMLGLGETEDEVKKTLEDLREMGCDVVTIGQYLRPSKGALPVKEYIKPDVFKRYNDISLKYGFKRVFSGPFVRSSYHAEETLRRHYGKKSSA